MMMDNERREDLFRLWGEETSDPETEEWRDDLTPEERDFVAALDNDFSRGMLRLCSVILIRDKLRQRYDPRMVEELTALRDCCRLKLKDGQVYLASLDRNNDLVLQPVEIVC